VILTYTSIIMRNLIVLIFISILLTGCGSAKDIRYLTPQEAMKYPVVMIANSDIDCGRRNTKIVKGTIFIVKEVGDYKYKIVSNDNLYRNIGLMFQKKNKLPEDALFIKLQEDLDTGFIVYPNGEFVYNNYFTFGFDSNGKLYTTLGQKCTFHEEPPFTLKDNR